MKLLKLVAVSVLFGAGVTTVNAADIINIPGITTTGNVTLSTDYRFRGISQTSNNPAIQGAINFNHESGLYAGVWGSNIDGFGTAEMDATLGYATKLNLIPNVTSTLDVGYIRYGYFGSGDSAPGNEQPDYNEVFAKLGFSDAIVKGDNLVGGVNYSNEYFNNSNDFWYLSANYTAPLADTGFGLVAGVGYNAFKNKKMMLRAVGGDGNDDNYIDYKVGANFGVQGLTGELAWVDNNIDSSDKIHDGTVQFSLSKSF
jgi:uncharacterized protein (TIGR02001 family)